MYNTNTWNILVKEEFFEMRIFERIHNIAKTIEANASQIEEPGLLGGKTGIGLFWQYFSLHTENQMHRNYCSESINSSLSAIAEFPLPYIFSNGISGILWALAHMSNNNYLNADLDSLISHEIHEFLIRCSKLEIKQSSYDYFHGGLSAFPYFLEQSINPTCRNAIYELLVELEKVCETFPEGITWFAGCRFLMQKEKNYDMGMAHGLPSIIVLLSKAHELKIYPELTSKLLTHSIDWLLTKKHAGQQNGFFPSMLPTQMPFFSRIAWCYGDLGISIALLQAGFAMNDSELSEEAITIAKNAAKRTYSNAGTKDACLCHGTAGIAHIFNRFFQYTHIAEFKEAGLYWYQQTLDLYDMNGHFKTFTRDMDGTNQRYELKYGFLEGIAGIGLSLLSAVTDIEPKWDRCLLLS